MKKLLLPLILLLLIISPRSVFASDLNVNCGTSYCTLSTKDPVFSPETKWTPGKTVSREVEIQNSDTASKEIYIRARDNETSAKELDSYMNISLLNGNVTVWQGTLADFINAGNIQVMNLAGGDNFTLEIEAEMASLIPNDMMGKSSVFNFGFGFEGENREEESPNGNSSSSSSSSESGNSENLDTYSLTSEDSGFLGAAFGRFFGVFIDEGDAATVAGENTNIPEEKDVLGAGVSVCYENYLWVIVLIAQLLFSFIILIKRFEKRMKLLFAGHSIMFGISALSIYFLSCMLWPILISLAIFVIPALWIFLKHRKAV